mgnify:CR=1 FL=1
MPCTRCIETYETNCFYDRKLSRRTLKKADQQGRSE